MKRYKNWAELVLRSFTVWWSRLLLLVQCFPSCWMDVGSRCLWRSFSVVMVTSLLRLYRLQVDVKRENQINKLWEDSRQMWGKPTEHCCTQHLVNDLLMYLGSFVTSDIFVSSEPSGPAKVVKAGNPPKPRRGGKVRLRFGDSLFDRFCTDMSSAHPLVSPRSLIGPISHFEAPVAEVRHGPLS